MKLEYNKQQLKELIERAFTFKPKEIPRFDTETIYTLERIQCDEHLESIRERQSKIDNIYFFDDLRFCAFYTPPNAHFEILNGCISCLTNRITHVRHSSKCNCNCDFCYHKGEDFSQREVPAYGYRLSNINYFLSLIETKLMLQRQVFGMVDSVGWLEKEPLMELEKLIPLAQYIKDNGKYQYLYTNGILLTEDVAKQLADCGIMDIRFNLQATDFSTQALDNMLKCVNIIENVAIESPMYSKTLANFIRHKDLIGNSGIKQINSPELQVKQNNINFFEKTEGICYRHRKGYVSPLTSRHYTYDLIEMAEKEKWPIIINDCSNETKFYRCVPKGEKYVISYSSQFALLPKKNYFDIIDNLKEDTLVIYE